MKKIIILLTLIVIQGCSSIPLSTMWKMKSFDGDDFSQIRAQDLRVQLRIDKKIQVDDDSLTLSFNFKSDSEELNEELGLQLLNHASREINNLFSKNEIEYSYEFRLNKESMLVFQRLQKSKIANRLEGKEEKGQTEFSARWKIGENKQQIYTFSIDLQFDPQDGYFTLFEGVELDTSKREQTL